jgi:hypothetical protein
MRPEAFTDEAPGDVEIFDGVFSFIPDPLPPDLESTHELGRLHGDAIYAIGRLADLDVWIDTPEIILSPLIHREATESSNIETSTRVTLSDLYRREAGETPGRTTMSGRTSRRRVATSPQSRRALTGYGAGRTSTRTYSVTFTNSC